MRKKVIRFLAHGASEQPLKPGEVLFRRGERAHLFSLIPHGRIAI